MGFFDWLRGRRRRPNAPLPAALAMTAPAASGFAVIDVETTGLDPNVDRVVEIAVVCTDSYGVVVDEWTTLINPDRPVGARSVHGISAADVRDAPRFASVVGALTARLSGRAVVAHNARFDLGFLRAEYARAGWTLPAVPFLCTLEASSLYLPDLARRRLQECCWAFDIALLDAHSALADARATASLLGCYLRIAQGLRPPPHHLTVPAIAAGVSWPAIPVAAFKAVARGANGTRGIPVPPGTLWALLDALPLSSAVEQGAPVEATAYLELVFEVLEDGVLTADEAQSLADAAGMYGLTREQVQAAHQGFLMALAHRIVEDGKVTKAERNLLDAAAAALGVDNDLPGRVLDEARAALLAQRSTDCLPLPLNWSHGEPLRVGQPVVFTGCDPLERARLEGQAQASGLRVTGSVSRKTVVLVTDGGNPNTAKARKARELGTRVVRPDAFALLVKYIQPAAPEVEPTPGADTVAATGKSLPPFMPSDPAAVRDWARANGLPVGVRGRIPADVIDAFAAANGADHVSAAAT